MRDFQFGVQYVFAVRSLSFLPNDASLLNAIESNQSELLAHTPKDTFPPTAPTSVTIASVNGQVSLFWPLNPEADVAGYNIYRSENEKDWVKLNAQLHKTASFKDDRVGIGKLYFYQITAVDVYGNESSKSSTVSETVAQ
jgi:fibronectin type 3 domain-containing protein